MGHVVLLGDSIFDNARYVPGGPAMVEHLGRYLPGGWRATLGGGGKIARAVARVVTEHDFAAAGCRVYA